jgi:polyribonucleotide 5'-hydroxyl-kinase
MLSAVSINKPIDPQEGFSSAVPLVYFFGGVSPSENAKLYKTQMQHLATQVNKRLQEDADARAGGVVINTCGWVDGQGYELLLDSIDIFAPDFVLVISHERLFSDLTQRVRNSGPANVQILKMAKSGGVVVRDSTFRRKTRMSKIREYFYGRVNDLHPHTSVLDYRDFTIVRIGAASLAPATALPIGAESSADPLKIQTITPSADLLHSILGVSYADSAQKVLEANIAGYVYVYDCGSLAVCRLPFSCNLTDRFAARM